MKRVFACLLAGFLLLNVMSLVTPAGADPEHDRLAAMCGTWNVDMTLWPQPGAQSMNAPATSTITSLFDGKFVQEKIEGTVMGMAFTTLAWTGYNPGTKQYEATRISSTNPVRIAEAGTYDETKEQFELKADMVMAGATWHQRTVIQQASPDAMVATSYLSSDAVPEWKAVEIRYTRKAE